MAPLPDHLQIKMEKTTWGNLPEFPESGLPESEKEHYQDNRSNHSEMEVYAFRRKGKVEALIYASTAFVGEADIVNRQNGLINIALAGKSIHVSGLETGTEKIPLEASRIFVSNYNPNFSIIGDEQKEAIKISTLLRGNKERKIFTIKLSNESAIHIDGGINRAKFNAVVPSSLIGNAKIPDAGGRIGGEVITLGKNTLEYYDPSDKRDEDSHGEMKVTVTHGKLKPRTVDWEKKTTKEMLEELKKTVDAMKAEEKSMSGQHR